MVKIVNVVLLSLLLALAAFAKGPVQEYSTASSSGSADPLLLAPWGLDVVTWTTVGTAPTVFGRSGGGILGNYMYEFGSEGVNTAQAFNLTTEAWEASTPATYGYDNWASATTTDAIYLIGGYNGTTAFNYTQKFVPSGGGPTGTWTQMAVYPLAVYGPTAAWDGSDLIYVASGNTMSGYSLTAYKYSISANTWTQLANPPVSQSFSGSAYVAGKFYVFGGTDAAGLGTRHYAYDPTANTWTAMASVPTAVWFATSSTTFNQAYMFSVGGGGGYGSWPATNAVQIYDPAANSWSQETPLPVARGCNQARWTLPDKVISGGGYAGGYSGVTYRGEGFPGGADPLAPAAPTGFTVSNNGAALTATLAWTNPTTSVNGTPLPPTPLTVQIKRNGAPLTSLTGTPGQAMTYNDGVPSVGPYDYQVYCTNSYGNGLPANASAWIGLDTPGGVTSLTGTGVGVTLAAELNWVNPLAGAHGGYWPPLSITGYTINRYGPSTATFTLTGIYTTYTDNTVPVQGWYHYGVIASNGSGNGPEVMTANFYVGPPEMAAIPFNWVEINAVGTNTGITQDDQVLGPFPMGIGFNHYGNTYNSVYVCSNGDLQFTTPTSTAYVNGVIPSVATPNNAIYPLWDDLYPPGPPVGIIYYYYDAANSRFIVEWDNVMCYATPRTPQKFEAILYPNGDIDFMYHTIQGLSLNSSTVGKENAAGTVAVQATFNGSGPLEPASSTGIRIYGAPPPVQDVTFTLVPLVYPIQIPASGGSFNFYAFVTNNETSPVQVALWIEQILPDSTTQGPLLGPVTVTLDPGTRGWYRAQNVPGTAMPGTYTYIGKAGTYPLIVWDSDQFNYTKLTTGLDGPWVGNWDNWGDAIGDEATQVINVLPNEFAMKMAYPNPFNPTTTISYQLPVGSIVNMTVYDLAGRQVGELVNSWKDAGSHEVTFEGSNLASGIYIYRLTAGSFSAAGKMVLMK